MICLSKSPVSKKFRPKVKEKERSFLRPNEIGLLLEAAKDHWIGPAIWLGCYSALRPCEIQALRCHAVDLLRGEITICSAYNRKEKRIQPFPKQKNWGRAAIPPELAEYLAPIIKSKSVDSFVCEGPNGGMLSYQTFYTTLKRLCKLSGVTEITPHELRHSATEVYVEMGASMEDIRRLLNHSSLSSTKRYMHRTDDRLKGFANKISLVSQAKGDEPPPPLKLVESL